MLDSGIFRIGGEKKSSFMRFMKRLLLLLACAFPAVLRAGPPFVTDDPEPVEYRHWEVYLASQLYHTAGTWSGTAPQIEVNYGAIPNLQLHLIVSDAFIAPVSGAKAMGMGDTELGAKYRFVQQTDYFPEIATFPLLELPTADQSRGLGDAHPQLYLPIWMQKDFGKWSTYGGGGYWINPGAANQNWWYMGWLVQRQITDHLALGTEVFHETAQVRFGQSSTYINTGGVWDLNDQDHILFSMGHTIQGQSGYQGYVAIQFTFGAEAKK